MTTSKYIIILLSMSFFGLTSCIDEYWPEVSRYQNQLVVDGGISNELPPYTIKLSKSSPANEIDYMPYSGCTLIIEDGDGEQEYLKETEEGTYQSSTNGMQGSIGQKYRLKIQTPDGKSYESDYDYIKNPVTIENVYAKTETQESNEVDHTLYGYQFYVSTENTISDSNFYLWKLEYTSHYQSDYFIKYYYDGQVRLFQPIDSLFNCYYTGSVKSIYTFNTDQLTNKKLENYPLHFVNTESRMLSLRYSLNVNQHTISKKAFKFWSALEEQNSEQGSLYSRQPYQIQGNIKNVNDEGEPVLGYFLVSGVDTKRIFVDRPEVPFYYTDCTINDGNYKQYAELYWADPVFYPIYIIVYEGNRAVPGQPCADCRQRGGTIVKPEFWED
ncbi:MAG: hypothetical protein C0598_01000 [Marinilabiliales bacterium]|nr:MAG: hypothetical protein C0598_01000 [Marinilabiliales bacterium]